MTVYTKTTLNGRTGYLVHTSKADQGHQTATAFVYQVGAKKWEVQDWDHGLNYTGTSRKAAMEAMYAARAKWAEAEKDAEAAKPLRDSFYAEMDRLEKKSGRLTTMYHALMGGLENADDTVGEGNVVADSAAYWELAWSGYESNKCEIDPDDQELAEEHDLNDLARCAYCGRAVVDPQLLDDAHYCDECLPVVKWDIYNDENPEGVQAASQVATDAGHMACTNEWYAAFLAAYEA